jgi:hypothetical protein
MPNGEVPEWLKEQFAKLSPGNWCMGSNPILSATVVEISEIPSGCSVARLSRLLWEQEVASSNLATPTQEPSFSFEIRLFYFTYLTFSFNTFGV